MPLVVGAALSLSLAGCGRAASHPSTQRSAVGPAVPLRDATYLQVAYGSSHRPTAVPLLDGALVIGGVEPRGGSAEAPRWSPLAQGAVVRGDGMVQPVGAPPSDAPLANLSAGSHGGRVAVVGVTCDEGTGPDDVGAIRCTPGNPYMAVLEVGDLTWKRVALPHDAPPPGGFVGDQQVYVLGDGRLAYTVQPDGQSPAVHGWITGDDGLTWDPLPAPAGWFLCATRGSLLAFHDDVASPDSVVAPSRPSVPFTTRVRVFDAARRTWSDDDSPLPKVAVRPGSAEGSCMPEAGFVDLVLNDQGGAVITFLPGTGWRSQGGSEWATRGGVVPTAGTEVLIGDVRGGHVTVLDVATGRSRTVALPAGKLAIAALGAARALVAGSESSQLEIVSL